MKTTKPISTISFNSPDYLHTKLTELTKAGRIAFWAFIVHLPEDDEGGKKEHCHVFVEPAKMVQTEDLKQELKEFDPKHPDKPLGCISWHNSKFDDWYMYALHDKAYLASKAQSRKYHYKHDDMFTSDDDDMTFRVRSIDRTAVSPYEAMREAQSMGMTFPEFVASGRVPIPQLRMYREAWALMWNNWTHRVGRDGHPNEPEQEALTPHLCTEETGKALQGECVQAVDMSTGECIEDFDDIGDLYK